MYHVYIIQDHGGKRYIGCTGDLAKRLADHNHGVSKWTLRSAGKWTLIWSREFPTLGDARRFENQLKRQKGGDGFKKLTGLDPSGS